MFIFHLEDHHLQPPAVSSFSFKLPKSTTIRKWPKTRTILLKEASHTAFIGSEHSVSQHYHERINQNDQRQPLKLTIIPSSCVLLLLLSLRKKTANTMKKFIVFANTMKKLIVFGKHYEKNNSVWQTL